MEADTEAPGDAADAAVLEAADDDVDPPQPEIASPTTAREETDSRTRVRITWSQYVTVAG
jgi:hypothetical protein